ncbi:PREDICTED: uncharacterized protein LOC109192892 [Ipomoea nil]|uniref:uncharacterized protein LOC109192892 n=1 Tax=Ipomoea nil TaxID=35883 RepID=UPI00090190B1|nr:PREDICTED: uncharacterized protein LOC109192892 [Ipomoea nil]
MALVFILGKDIKLSTYKKAIRLRLIRTYTVPEGCNSLDSIKSQECVFHDAEGTYIHGNIPKECVEKYSKLLKEGKVYAIKDFAVISHYYQYKTTDHSYIIRFSHENTVERHRRKGFPLLMFRLKSYIDLMSGNVSEKHLIDVIGRVVEYYTPKEILIAGFPSKLVDFLIEDGQGNRLKCTVWDQHVDTAMHYFKTHVEGPLIVLLQLCRAKKVDNEFRISSSYNATQLWFNHPCKEVQKFKDSLKVDTRPPLNVQTVSHMSHGNAAENSKTPMTVTTIEDLYERVEEGYYWVPGRIVAVESTTNWFYHSCRSEGCFRKLHLKNGALQCLKCGTSWHEGNLRYRLIVRVGDKTTDAPFLLWDKEGCEIIGKTAFDIRSKYSMDGSPLLTGMEEVRNKAMVFKISAKSDHFKNRAIAIPVVGIAYDEDLIDHYCPCLSDDQDQLSRMLNEEDPDAESDESESGDEASSPNPIQAKKQKVDEQDEPLEAVSSKRNLLDQFSSRRDVKKAKAVLVKHEKN